MAYWIEVYTEILGKHEHVLARVKELLATRATQPRDEVVLATIMSLAAQVETFEQRLAYWEARKRSTEPWPGKPAARRGVRRAPRS